jgi:hypothetical protein
MPSSSGSVVLSPKSSNGLYGAVGSVVDCVPEVGLAVDIGVGIVLAHLVVGVIDVGDLVGIDVAVTPEDVDGAGVSCVGVDPHVRSLLPSRDDKVPALRARYAHGVARVVLCDEHVDGGDVPGGIFHIGLEDGLAPVSFGGTGRQVLGFTHAVTRGVDAIIRVKPVALSGVVQVGGPDADVAVLIGLGERRAAEHVAFGTIPLGDDDTGPDVVAKEAVGPRPILVVLIGGRVDRVGTVPRLVRRNAVVVVHGVGGDGEADLALVAGALDVLRGLTCCAERRQEDTDEQGDDGDHNQQFDEREG